MRQSKPCSRLLSYGRGLLSIRRLTRPKRCAFTLLLSSIISAVMDFEAFNNSTLLAGKSGNTTFPQVQLSLPRLESMTKHLLPSDLLHLSPDSRFLQFVLWCIVFLLSNLVFVYIATWISFTRQRLSRGVGKVPPMLPYMIPFFGNAISLAFDPAETLARIRSVHPSRLMSPG